MGGSAAPPKGRFAAQAASGGPPLSAASILRRSRPLDRTAAKRNPSEDEIAADAFGPKRRNTLRRTA